MPLPSSIVAPKKSCPLKGPNPEPRRVLAHDVNDTSSNACTGHECMFFVTFTTDGKAIGGNCALIMGAIALVNIEQRLAAMMPGTEATVTAADDPLPTKAN